MLVVGAFIGNDLEMALRVEPLEDTIDGLCDEMKLHHITIPIVAIGGILSSDIPDVMATGVSGIAVSGAILNADSPVEEMQRFIRLTEKEIAK